ncbi:MAG: LPS export ABC transporter permease LptG [Acidobacteria bacterium]|nr:MAG: LPS export ABC transporter permease LptG [Acidobacteriota bacterium]
MRILTRYIFKEIFGHCLLGLVVFTFVLYVRPLSQILELVARRNLSVAQDAYLFLLLLPRILVITIPMAVLLGTLIGLSRMSADSETIAIRAAGISKSQVLRPVLMFALCGWVMTSWMSLFLAPAAARTLERSESGLAATQASYDIQPRVFIEQFPHLLLYLKDISSSNTRWRGVFIVDRSQSNEPKVTLAESGRLVQDDASGQTMLYLENGATHEFDSQRRQQYTVTSFANWEVPISGLGANAEQRLTPAMLSPAALIAGLRTPEGRQAAMVEINYRLALPVACLVLAIVGVPIGLISRKGGKAFGLMLSILLVFIYYVLMASGLNLAKEGRLNPLTGLWMANVVFAISGLIMLRQTNRVRTGVDSLHAGLEKISRALEHFHEGTSEREGQQSELKRGRFGGRAFQILDLYVFRSWLFYLGILLVTFTGIYMIFDFFQLLGDIVRHQVSPELVVEYYWYLAPQIIYLMLPLSILVATLVSLGLLSKANEVTAIKSAGISLYRISVPILVGAGLLSGGMFLLGNNYLPETNQQQDSLRNQIKGKPAQTMYRPDRQWISGNADKIYNYRFFDADLNVFASLSVFEIDPNSFRLKRRIYAERAFWEPQIHRWVLENGWTRDFSEGSVTDYQPFSVRTFNEMGEAPSYFKKEVKPSEQMSVLELRQYIQSLKQSGFDVVRLSVALYRKFSYPLIAFVVTLIAIPFAFSTGSRGALAGIAISIGVAIVYWSVSSLFEAMGNLSQLPPAVAAWSPDILFSLAGIYLLTRIKT